MGKLRNPNPPPPPEKGSRRAAKEIKKDQQIMIRVTSEYKEKVAAAAESKGLTVSNFILSAIDSKLEE